MREQRDSTMRRFDTRFQRLELKYVIDEPTAVRIRRDLASYCDMDAHCTAPQGGAAGGAPNSYLIKTLYLDTPSLTFHQAKERGEAERFKLRIRKYTGRGAIAVELKRRSRDIIDKTRAMVEPDGIEAAARGTGKPIDDSAEGQQFLGQFSRLVATTGAKPSLLVRYWREAHASRVDSYARVTFDRRIAMQRTRAWSADGDPAGWCELDHHLVRRAPRPFVVLEFKCQLRVPEWMTDLIRRHCLWRGSISKYSLGIYLTDRKLGAASRVQRCGGVLQ
jgi:hypothetical protein